jgi:hypothetical protein
MALRQLVDLLGLIAFRRPISGSLAGFVHYAGKYQYRTETYDMRLTNLPLNVSGVSALLFWPIFYLYTALIKVGYKSFDWINFLLTFIHSVIVEDTSTLKRPGSLSVYEGG